MRELFGFNHFCVVPPGIYGTYFEDENLEINHTDVGFIAMANRGPDTNGCQFYINTLRTPWLDGKHTIFGKVLGYGQRVVHMIEKVKLSPCSAIFSVLHLHLSFISLDFSLSVPV